MIQKVIKFGLHCAGVSDASLILNAKVDLFGSCGYQVIISDNQELYVIVRVRNKFTVLLIEKHRTYQNPNQSLP